MGVTDSGLTVAVTGPTGTLGEGLMPLLQADDRVRRITGIARRPFDPAAHGWPKMRYQQGDVRDPATLEAAFHGCDVVIHLAFQVMGTTGSRAIRQINVDGTRNAFRAAAAVGAGRFVYPSSVAAYGFHPDNPIGMTEDWPVRPAAKLFYAQEKAELERLLALESAARPGMALYVLRPPIVVGPHTLGAKNPLPAPVSALGRRLTALFGRIRLPVAAPDFPLQLIHEQDAGQALLRCAVGAGPPGVYNIAGPGIVSIVDLCRAVGLIPVPVPDGPLRGVARLASALPSPPFLPPVTQWIEVVSHPAIMDVTKAGRELGWTPHYTARQALHDALRPRPA